MLATRLKKIMYLIIFLIGTKSIFTQEADVSSEVSPSVNFSVDSSIAPSTTQSATAITDTQTDRFLDESFAEESMDDDNAEHLDATDGVQAYDTIDEQLIDDPRESRTVVSTENMFTISYHWLNRDSSLLSRCTKNTCTVQDYNTPIFFPQYQLSNSIQTDVYFANAGGWFYLHVIPRVYLEAKEPEQFTQLDSLNTFLGLEISKAQAGFRIWDSKAHLTVGKFSRSISTAFLYNPADPEVTRYTHSSIWRNHPSQFSYQTAQAIDTFSDLHGSNRDVGQWRLELGLLFSWASFYFSYLPKLDTFLHEFYRENHSYQFTFLPKFGNDLTLGLTLYYDDAFFAGMSASYGIGNEITLQAELSADLGARSILIVTDGTLLLGPTLGFDHYSIVSQKSDVLEMGQIISGIAGVSYTPQNLFTLLFELSYNGKGLSKDEWSTQIQNLERVIDTYAMLQSLDASLRPLSEAYAGLIGYYARAYDPLQLAPLYMILRISRANVFESLWSERIDAETSLIYSPFDGSFLVEAEVSWLAQRVLELSVGYRTVFGARDGVFTVLPHRHRLALTSTWVF